jgi:hypothetical protein
MSAGCLHDRSALFPSWFQTMEQALSVGRKAVAVITLMDSRPVASQMYQKHLLLLRCLPGFRGIRAYSTISTYVYS